MDLKMRMKWLLATISFLLFISGAQGQIPHPRIWLDSSTMARLTRLKNANDATWTALKRDADAYVTTSVPPYDRNTCRASEICYAYQGSGWFDALSKLSFAYKMTGDV